MNTNNPIYKYASNPDDVKNYNTSQLRKTFLIDNIFSPDESIWSYCEYDRFIVGGIMPVTKKIKLETFDILKSSSFLERREIGIINIGGTAIIDVDTIKYELLNKEAIYIGQGYRDIIFESKDKSNPAKLYANSTLANKSFPIKKIDLAHADTIEIGNSNDANHRKVNRIIVSSVVDTCQLQMGLTEFMPGSVWNTMPPHTHNRRMEVYFYFNIPDNQSICHFMGKPDETRHIWIQNEQAVISPPWSIHSGVGTSTYSFIWGMAGENLDYSDMDVVLPCNLK